MLHGHQSSVLATRLQVINKNLYNMTQLQTVSARLINKALLQTDSARFNNCFESNQGFAVGTQLGNIGKFVSSKQSVLLEQEKGARKC